MMSIPWKDPDIIKISSNHFINLKHLMTDSTRNKQNVANFHLQM